MPTYCLPNVGPKPRRVQGVGANLEAHADDNLIRKVSAKKTKDVLIAKKI